MLNLMLTHGIEGVSSGVDGKNEDEENIAIPPNNRNTLGAPTN